jgi:hypothetical protein
MFSLNCEICSQRNLNISGAKKTLKCVTATVIVQEIRNTCIDFHGN